MAMVNPMLNLVNNPNVKDSRWLTLEVCREHQRNKCTRTEQECKFAHPPPHVEVQNGRVIACFDSIKGKCQRENPKCKYLHPPQHLREQLLQNGRNNLILKNLQLQAAASTLHPCVPVPGGMMSFGSGKAASTAYQPLQSVIPGQYPIMDLNQRLLMGRGYPDYATDIGKQWQLGTGQILAPPYMSTMPSAAAAVSYNPYLSASIPTSMTVPSGVNDGSSYMSQIPTGMIPTQVQPTQQKVARPDRLEVCREFQRGTCTRQPSECRYAHPPDNVTIEGADNHVTVCMDFVKGKCIRDSCRYFHPPPHLQMQIKAAQQRANATIASQSPSLTQVVEVLTTGKKRPRDPADDLILGFPNMVPHIKRMAVTDSKSGIPVYQPSSMGMSAAYQHATMMQLQQQPFIPVTFAGHPPSVQRF